MRNAIKVAERSVESIEGIAEEQLLRPMEGS